MVSCVWLGVRAPAAEYCFAYLYSFVFFLLHLPCYSIKSGFISAHEWVHPFSFPCLPCPREENVRESSCYCLATAQS